MNLMLSLVMILLVVVTLEYSVFVAWKIKDIKTLSLQIIFGGLAIIAGILLIYHVPVPSMSRLLTLLTPFEK
ncbi:hypothetical protein ACFO4N_00035 [Camelliibacillus cellulosilyticus]|uniref:Uncharacterized protein n=1 Tax=Camelliibacillus cellulosilyticus TaxID=2174486 RepID=A0ABV9GHT3_9BACL